MHSKTHTAFGIPRTPIRFLLYVSRPWRWMGVAVLFVFLAEVVGLSGFVFFQHIIDSASAGNLTTVVVFCVAYPLVLYLAQVLWRASGLTGMRWNADVEAETAKVLTNHLYSHSHTFFINRFAGSLLSNVSNVVEGNKHLINDFLWTILSATISFLVAFALIFRVDAYTGLLFLALLLSLLVLNKRLAPKKRSLSEINAKALTGLRGLTVDILSNMAAVRQFASVDNEYRRTKEHILRRQRAGMQSWRYSEFSMLINCTVLFVFLSGMLFTLLQRWVADDITTGQLVLVLSLVSNLSYTLVFIGRAFNSVAEGLGEIAEGLKEILQEHEIVDVLNAKPLVLGIGKVSFDEMSFGYGEQKVFDGFQLTIRPGERVGLVGHSGAGKTTLVSLLLRQHNLTDGAILIDGQDIAKVTQDSLRRAISVVPQDPALFHRTIRENIAYGKSDATDKEIEDVAKMAQAHEFIMALPKGYDTLVGERGVKLSGGQRQRVAIARAMLKSAPILVLDEATSALDSESEVAIQKALHVLMEGKTVLAIAHRLSTLREMDRIIVLENGKIVEDGSHGDLVTRKGTYARLWEHQAGGFIQE